jgi:acyl-CoA thioester hydrolase
MLLPMMISMPSTIESPLVSTAFLPPSEFTFRVQIFDTDCYGVMWHGAYVKWLEMARCQLLEERGVALSYPGQGYVYPVVEQHHRFKQPARLNDCLVIRTTPRVKGPRLLFEQTLLKAATSSTPESILLQSETTCIVSDATFKPYRRIPADLLERLRPEAIS